MNKLKILTQDFDPFSDVNNTLKKLRSVICRQSAQRVGASPKCHVKIEVINGNKKSDIYGS